MRIRADPDPKHCTKPPLPFLALRFLALSILAAIPSTGERSEGLGPGLLLPVRFKISEQEQRI